MIASCRPVAEADEMGEGVLDARLVGLDRLDGEQLPALVLARGVADQGRAAAHQRHGLAAGLLQPVQHHDLDERADVQRRRRAVEADIGDEVARAGLVVEAREVRALMDIAALLHHAQEVGCGLETFRSRRGSFGRKSGRGLGKGQGNRNRQARGAEPPRPAGRFCRRSMTASLAAVPPPGASPTMNTILMAAWLILASVTIVSPLAGASRSRATCSFRASATWRSGGVYYPGLTIAGAAEPLSLSWRSASFWRRRPRPPVVLAHCAGARRGGAGPHPLLGPDRADERALAVGPIPSDRGLSPGRLRAETVPGRPQRASGPLGAVAHLPRRRLDGALSRFWSRRRWCRSGDGLSRGVGLGRRRVRRRLADLHQGGRVAMLERLLLALDLQNGRLVVGPAAVGMDR